MTTTVAIVGHSHTGCVSYALTAAAKPWEAPAGLDVRVLNITQLVIKLGIDQRDQTQIQAGVPPRLHTAVGVEIDRMLIEPGSRIHFVSMVGGNRHNLMGLLRHDIPFDFVLPDAPDLPLEPGTQIIPYGAMRALLERRLNYERCTLEALRRQYPYPCLHIESPPPPRDDEFVMTSLDEGYRVQGVSAGVVSAALRYKLWRLHSTIVERMCHEFGIRFVKAPVEACDPDGFLKREAYGNATHANTWYGRLVLNQIAALAMPPQGDRRVA